MAWHPALRLEIRREFRRLAPEPHAALSLAGRSEVEPYLDAAGPGWRQRRAGGRYTNEFVRAVKLERPERSSPFADAERCTAKTSAGYRCIKQREARTTVCASHRR